MERKTREVLHLAVMCALYDVIYVLSKKHFYQKARIIQAFWFLF